jgi:anti-sigma factor (TIGR02949 family)
MGDCSRLVALLTEYLEGRLSQDLRSDLEHHLEGCPECVAFVRTFRSTVSLVQSLTEQDLPPELRLRLRAFLDEHGRS